MKTAVDPEAREFKCFVPVMNNSVITHCMIILDILECVYRIIRVCIGHYKRPSTGAYACMCTCPYAASGTDVFIWGTIGFSKHVGSFLHA